MMTAGGNAAGLVHVNLHRPLTQDSHLALRGAAAIHDPGARPASGVLEEGGFPTHLLHGREVIALVGPARAKTEWSEILR
jgi:hypothetical protein